MSQAICLSHPIELFSFLFHYRHTGTGQYSKPNHVLKEKIFYISNPMEVYYKIQIKSKQNVLFFLQEYPIKHKQSDRSIHVMVMNTLALQLQCLNLNPLLQIMESLYLHSSFWENVFVAGDES